MLRSLFSLIGLMLIAALIFSAPALAKAFGTETATVFVLAAILSDLPRLNSAIYSRGRADRVKAAERPLHRATPFVFGLSSVALAFVAVAGTPSQLATILASFWFLVASLKTLECVLPPPGTTQFSRTYEFSNTAGPQGR